MLLAGFPAVTAFALLTVGPYLLVRVVARRRADGAGRSGARCCSSAAAWSAASPWPRCSCCRGCTSTSTWWIDGRAQTPGAILSPAYLVTMFAPWTFGSAGQPPDAPTWYPGGPATTWSRRRPISAPPRWSWLWSPSPPPGRRESLLPRGVWAFLVAAAALGSPSSTRPGRCTCWSSCRCSPRTSSGGRAACSGSCWPCWPRWASRCCCARGRGAHLTGPVAGQRWWGPAVGLGAAVGVALLVVKARSVAAAADERPGLSALAVRAPADRRSGWSSSRWRRAPRGPAVEPDRPFGRSDPPYHRIRFAATTVLFGLIVGQGLSYAGPYWPRVARDTYYPVTDTHQFLADTLATTGTSAPGTRCTRARTRTTSCARCPGTRWSTPSWPRC